MRPASSSATGRSRIWCRSIAIRARSLPVTQFNMKWVEQAGLVKFDFLGLKTLTVLEKAVELIRRRGVEIDLAALPLDDKPSFAMLARGETVGVFQVEGQGMRRALVGMQPDRFEDLIALVALYRPGPMANIPLYCARKLGKEETDYIHPELEPILKATYGVITYQEQVMQIARDLAGYSLGEADLLRRAMGKKIRAEMESQRVRFISGAAERGIEHADAVAIFDACAKFADYGFNKSHSAPYALITYQTAYLKANYPGRVPGGVDDARHEQHRQAERIPPGGAAARHRGRAARRQPLGRRLRGFRWRDRLCARRAEGRRRATSPSTWSRCAASQAASGDLADFAHRIDPQIVNRKALECLVQAGAFDSIEPQRAKAFANIGKIARRRAGADRAERERHHRPLRRQAASRRRSSSSEADPWPQSERLQREFAAIGTYLSAHPIDDYAALAAARGGLTWKAFFDQLRTQRQFTAQIAATVVQRQERRTRTGGRIGIVTLSDPTAQFEATVYQERLADWRDLLEPGQSLLVQIGGEYDPDAEEVRARIQAIEQLEAVAARKSHAIRVFLDAPGPIERLASRLDKGEGSVSVVLMLREREVEVKLPGPYRVTPQIAGAIKAVPGVVHVEMR